MEETVSPVILTPSHTLIFESNPGDWRESLFDLAAGRIKTASPVTAFWRQVAEIFMAALCRLPDDMGPASLAAPDEAQLEQLARTAPPMTGGEYLSVETLLSIWASLVRWTVEAVGASAAGLPKFLAARAPQWRRVGQVTFHLAENPADSAKPFAFMATYVTSLTREGRDRHLPLGQALKRYTSQSDWPALLGLLTPVKEAARRLEWVDELVESKAVYQPVAFTVSRAYQLLRDLPVLEESGLTVRIPDWWRRKPQVKVEVVIGSETTPSLGLSSLLDWDVRLAVGDQALSEDDIDELLAGGDEGLVLFKGQWLEVDRDRLQQALEHWRGVRAGSGSGLEFIQAMRLLAGLPGAGPGGAGSGSGDRGPWVVPVAGKAMTRVLDSLRRPEAVGQPPELTGTLRPYQLKGLGWLSTLGALGLGACLADDMGLGKTIQVLAWLLKDKAARPGAGPALLVAPASLLANWRSEADRFAPTLRVLVWHPSEVGQEVWARGRKAFGGLADESDLVVTSYAMAARQKDLLEPRRWRAVILDEAQAIKNPGTAQSKAVKRFQSPSRLVLTGTPIENRLTDLWSLFDFLNPGLLGSLKAFQEALQKLGETGAKDFYAPLRRLVSPYILRRLKTDRSIIDDLPDKVETTLHCHLTEDQARIYHQVVEALRASLEGMRSGEAPAGDFARRGMVLQALGRLRQVINHPAQLTGDGDWDPKRSGKFGRLEELCREMAERQDRLLVFTQYREIIDPLHDHLASIFGRPGLVFHGGTRVKERQGVVERFQSPDGPPFLILSLKAGGTGLNLTAAGQVIHFDRWWNPAVEDQATDRAYRIGQKRNVIIHKCVTRGTLEERVDELLRQKRALADGILASRGDKELDLTSLDDDELMRVVSLDLSRAVL
jgi:non-specific serine/threonine protein kinase